jgi:hypothetical protein
VCPFFRPEPVVQAHTKAVSAVFIAEALLLMEFWADLLRNRETGCGRS